VSALAAVDHAATVLCAVSAMAITYAVCTRHRVRLRWSSHAEALERDLRFLGARWTGQRVAMAQLVVIAVLVSTALLTAMLTPLAIALVVVYAPRIALQRKRRKRTEEMEQQLDGFLVALAHSLRANPALGDGIRSSAEVMKAPLADELQVLMRENDLGTPLDRALDNMAQRVQSPVVSSALSTLRVARSTGGDFVHTLERSASTLREMARLEGVVRTKTAEGRAQTWVVSVVPLPTLWAINKLAPELLEPLWESSMGHVVIGIAVCMWLIAIVAARRIVHVDI